MRAIIYKWNKANNDQEITSEQVVNSFIGTESEDRYKKGGNFNNCICQHLTSHYDQPIFESDSKQELFFDAIGQEYQKRVIELKKLAKNP